MKQCVSILAFLFLSMTLFAQAMTNEQIESDLKKQYEKIISFPYGGGNDIDSLELCDSLFQAKFAFYTSHYPSTLTYPFDSLQKDDKITIATSKDKLFRIYSWDTWDGGTMHSTTNLLQFKIENKVYAKYPTYKEDPQNDLELWYNNIYILKANHRTYYLGAGNGIYSTRMVGGAIRVFSIENHTLIDTVKLIKTKKGSTAFLGYSYQIGFLENTNKPLLPLYDSITHIIALPLSDHDGNATGKYRIYQFMGKYFEPINRK